MVLTIDILKKVIKLKTKITDISVTKDREKVRRLCLSAQREDFGHALTVCSPCECRNISVPGESRHI